MGSLKAARWTKEVLPTPESPSTKIRTLSMADILEEKKIVSRLVEKTRVGTNSAVIFTVMKQ